MKFASIRLTILILLLTFISFSPVTIAHAGSLPQQAIIRGVVGHAQHYGLTCESRSAADWATFWGVPLTEEAIEADLPRTDNPETGFVGDLNGAWGNIPPASYGVHPPPLVKVLRSFGLPAQEHSGLGWDGLRAEIAAGRPVIVWVIGWMWNGTPVSYTASDGQTTTVAAYEHVMMVIGYTPQQVIVIDAATGQQQAYDISDFMTSWSVLGQRAIVGEGQPKTATAASTPIPVTGSIDTVTVQSGDTLSGIAQRLGLSWPDIAALNGIPSPYIIYPGQVLHLPTH